MAAMEAVVEHSSDLLVMVHGAGDVIFANRAATLMFGVSLEEAIGTSVFSYVHPEDLDRVTAKFAGVRRFPLGDFPKLRTRARFSSPALVAVLVRGTAV